ncbi:MAG: sigma-70 family RNA polymerase sigma factor [Candidatus Riflebacteria bacterium]|nr:sigma-70 family RNA polymerase sigma factor [Candidatus Riflebacteria bacterium]
MKTESSTSKTLDCDISVFIRQVLDGKTTAFAEIVSRYQKKIYSMALGYTRNLDSALDLSQEIFLETYKSLHRYDQSRSFTNWILKVASNQCSKFVRKRVDIPSENNDSIPDVAQTNPLEIMIKDESRSDIMKAFNKLPEDQKMPVWLYYFFDRSCNQIAEILEIPLSSVKVRLFRARQTLGSLLEKKR